MDLIFAIIIGGIAGWLASTLMKGKGQGIIMNVLIGVLGAFVGAYIFPVLGIRIDGYLGVIARPTCGAIAVLFLAKVLAK